MRKLLLIAPIVIALWIAGCDNGTPSGAPDVTYEVKAPGDTLILTWTALSGVDGYNVYADGQSTDLGNVLSTKISDGAARVIEVCAYTNDKEGPKWSKDFSPVITTITVYANSDSVAHKSAFGFNTSGDAITYFLGTTADHSKFDFYIEDIAAPANSLTSPSQGGYNTRWSGSHEESVTDFDAFDQSAAPGNYVSPKQLIDGAVYSFWLDRNNSVTWDNNDHFGKAKVLAISDKEVQLKIAFQKEGGLRWVKTP
ncbi:MAG: hypothetical protein HY769_03755 [Candidatus Stahlbacteria bacterium]|nr:hypothetical protein [Candidatus Stahlbacteria bacterium]